jgi:hypothetical protein
MIILITHKYNKELSSHFLSNLEVQTIIHLIIYIYPTLDFLYIFKILTD